MRLSQQSGFSLLEMIAVVAIFLVLSAISLYAWNAYLPVMQLNSSANAMADTIELGMIKSVAEQNFWVFLVNYNVTNYHTNDGTTFFFPANSFLLFDDDGYLGDVSGRSRAYNALTRAGGTNESFSEEFDPETGNADLQWRHNMLMERPELFRGPIRLEGRVDLVRPAKPADMVLRIVFRHFDPRMIWSDAETVYDQPIPLDDQREEPARITLRDNLYVEGDNSRDNLTHRRIIRVDQSGVKVLGA